MASGSSPAGGHRICKPGLKTAAGQRRSMSRKSGYRLSEKIVVMEQDDDALTIFSTSTPRHAAAYQGFP
jgi:hypothetical protein